MEEPLNLHATTIAIDGRGVMLRGASGSGKSDLALRLIDRGALLVSDDRTLVARAGNGLLASAPPRIAGMIEVRGIGIATVAGAGATPLALIVDLDAVPDRLPDRQEETILDLPLPRIALDAFAASAPIKTELALRMLYP